MVDFSASFPSNQPDRASGLMLLALDRAPFVFSTEVDMRCVFLQALVFTAAVGLSSVWPQKAASQNTGEEGNTQKESRYSEASLKFDILEAQLQTLRKKMQLRNKAKAEQTKEWNEHFEKVKQQIEAWDDFVDSYGVK